ncbi:MAG: Ppx/GppA family phosphatase [Sphingomicrobium sp.]
MVYAGAKRARDPIFNEKVLAGLGRGLGDGGSLSPKSRARALRALKRFRRLLDEMQSGIVEIVATAAVRDAADGAEFVREVRRLGLPCRVLSAGEEARLAGEGILYAIPGADGLVGDLGGGSLELVDVDGRKIGNGLSLPLGVLRVESSAAGRKAAQRAIRSALSESGLTGKGRPLYLVGGSWRALARVDMALTGYPLPIIHNYHMAPKRARELVKVTAEAGEIWLKAAPSARHATAPAAAMLLELLVEEIEPSQLVVSAAGIREGLLHARMSAATRALDPLVEAARRRSREDIRFGPHGDQLDDWIAPLFNDDAPAMQRLRLASCLLADDAWQANSAFRAEHSIEAALHGNWIGVDAPERVLIATALSSSFGNSGLPDAQLASLCRPDDLERAHLWGLAIRLGQRLSAGVGTIFARAPLRVNGKTLGIDLQPGDEALAGEAVRGRLRKLAEAMGMQVGD